MFAGKYLLYEVQCMKHEHSTRIQCVCCSELWLLLKICSFCFFALLIFILSQKQYLNELVGVECLKAFAYYGTPQMILTYVYLAKTAWKRKRNIIQWILVVFLYINTTMAQSEIFYPSLIILLLLNGDSEKSSTSK